MPPQCSFKDTFLINTQTKYIHRQYRTLILKGSVVREAPWSCYKSFVYVLTIGRQQERRVFCGHSAVPVVQAAETVVEHSVLKVDQI